VQPSQRDRRKTHPRKRPGDRYTTRTYGATLHQAIERHNRKVPAERQIPHWHLHQLRHLRALELKREFGLDVARAVLGHKSPVIAEHYATLDIAAAAQAMAKLG
jgi:integrase